MDASMNAREKRSVYRSLILLVKALENRLVTVDLRNESSVSGQIVLVDAQMNITFSDAAFVENEGDYKYFPSLFVPSRMVRDVIIPDDMPITPTILSMLPKKPTKKVPQKKPMTFKRKRAQMQQQETLALVHNALKDRPSTSSSAPT